MGQGEQSGLQMTVVQDSHKEMERITRIDDSPHWRTLDASQEYTRGHSDFPSDPPAECYIPDISGGVG